jgi:hypothetical protein
MGERVNGERGKKRSAINPSLPSVNQVETMFRYHAKCSHCSQLSAWCGDVEESRREISGHLQAVHGIAAGREAADYRLMAERQCDYCLEPYLDDCTKCRRDFCAIHAGDIDGLCGGCI